MTRDTAKQLLSEDKDHLLAFAVKSLSIFGSTARNEAKPDSDVDILVEFEEDARIGLFRFIELKQHLEAVLHCPVDLGTIESIREPIRKRIIEEAIRVA